MTRNGKDVGNIPGGLPIILENFVKDIYTSMPGTVLSYDSTNRRASVRGSLDVVLEDGTILNRPVITGVPVVFPCADDFILEFLLSRNDQVLLIFSMRGLSHWKNVHAPSLPDLDAHFAERNALAIPGLGPRGAHSPSKKISVSDDSVTVSKDSSSVTVGDSISIISDDDLSISANGSTISAGDTGVTITTPTNTEFRVNGRII